MTNHFLREGSVKYPITVKRGKEGRVCRECSKWKSLENFYQQKHPTVKGRTIYLTRCKPCHITAAKQAPRYKLSREAVKRQMLVSKRWQYNVELDVLEKWYIDGCRICGTTENLHIDHCHDRNVARGVLCRNCNHGLGNFKDSPELLLSAVTYLKETECLQPEPKLPPLPPGRQRQKT